MQRITAWISVALLIAGTGFSKTVVTARNQAEGSDVVLESAVNEVTSIPVDAANVLGDAVQLVDDETMNAVEGVQSAFSGASVYENVKLARELEIDNAWKTSDDIVFRSYKVSDKIGELLLSTIDATSASTDVSTFFDDVEFAEGASAFYMPKLNSLLVYQTQKNILSIEMILAQYQGAHRDLRDHQVEVETKFVEVSQKTLNELGFSWRFTSKDGGGLKIFDDLVFPAGQDILAGGLRTAATALGGPGNAGVLAVSKSTGSLQWDLFISALEQDNDTDVLSAPRVVTLDGMTATIHVGEKRMMPQSFEVNNKDTSAFIEPTDWENEQLGVYMEVTPEIREEGLIDLELHPKVVDIVGYDSYQVMPKYTGVEDGVSGSGWVPTLERFFIGGPVSKTTWNSPLAVGDMPSISASLPFYRIRELETTVTVADGSTVAMGGLIYDKLETFRDKVPVLGSIPLIGRLFRSEGEKSVKRNLMIFVTATQVDVDGRRTADVVLNK